jgi:hypothetical protein
LKQLWALGMSKRHAVTTPSLQSAASTKDEPSVTSSSSVSTSLPTNLLQRVPTTVYHHILNMLSVVDVHQSLYTSSSTMQRSIIAYITGAPSLTLMPSSTCATWHHLAALWHATQLVVRYARHLRTFGDCPDAFIWPHSSSSGDHNYHTLLKRYHERMRVIMCSIVRHNAASLQSIWLEYIWKSRELLTLLMTTCTQLTRWNPMSYDQTQSRSDQLCHDALLHHTFRHHITSLSFHCHRPPLSFSYIEHGDFGDNDNDNDKGDEGVYGMVSPSTVLSYLSNHDITTRLQHLQIDVLPNVHLPLSSADNGLTLLARCTQLVKLDIGIHCDSLIWSSYTTHGDGDSNDGNDDNGVGNKHGVAHQLGTLVWPAMGHTLRDLEMLTMIHVNGD